MNVKNGDKMYHVELNNRLEAYKRNGVLDGLMVYERSIPSFTLNISAGKCYVDNEVYDEPISTVVVIGTAHATLPRLDIVCYDTSVGGAADTAGTPSATPVPPDIPAGDILLALIEVPPAHTTIENCHIIDERIIIKPTGTKYDVSDNLLASDDSEVSNNNAVYTLEKEFNVPNEIFEDESDFRIKFDMKSSTGGLVYGRIYRSGVFVGATQMSSSTSYATYSQDITSWSAGELMQLYTHSLDTGRSVYVQNFRVYGDIAHINVYDW